MLRDDLSNKLIHLTRSDQEDKEERYNEWVKNFQSIANQRKLIGGDGCIKGGYRCICFTEAPLSKLSHILAAPSASGIRYAPFGVIVAKRWLFGKGGRPVIYGPETDFYNLPEDMRYRHVRFELGNKEVDFTWEREWRLRADELSLEPAQVTLVVPTRESKDVFADLLPKDWHFIVLDDLGVEVPFPDYDD